jgi:hypothetical protein
MAQLEDVIDQLKEYDRFRREAAKLRESGCTALLNSLGPADRKVDRRFQWHERNKENILETAEVLKALLYCRTRDPALRSHRTALTDELEDVTGEAALGTGIDEVPVLRSAKALCALAASPDSAFSSSVMYFMYSIVRAIYVAGHPDWAVGGAGAGGGSDSSGFVTWQCVRAVRDFQTALRQTAELISEIATVVDSSEKYLRFYQGEPVELPEETNGSKIKPPPTPRAAWEEVDEKRLALSFAIEAMLRRENIALKLPSLHAIDSGTPEAVGAFVKTIRKELKEDIQKHLIDFEAAVEQIEVFRKGEAVRESIDAEVRRRIRWSETAHTAALLTVKDAVRYARKALACFGNAPDPAELRDLRDEFRRAAESFDELLGTVKAHVFRALDTQLAAASLASPAFEWDAGEMAFAAAACAELAPDQRVPPDQRIRRAAKHLLDAMGERGGFPLGRPMHTNQHQYALHAHTTEVIRALAMLLERAPDVEMEPAHAERMLAYFRDGEAIAGRLGGAGGPERYSRRLIASAVLSLARVNRMLDERINHEVFRHFSVKRPEDIELPPLRALFYGDYGLVHASREAAKDTDGKPGDKNKAKQHVLLTNGAYRDRSVAEVLERMREHVKGVAAAGHDPIFSLVLHGPPGTGKTTLVESLAKTCEVSLVEVTPSDIVIGGAERMEARARAVFAALSLLTRAVVLFDEFDPVVLRREPEEKHPSVFSFLTPGMLPKLKTLHDRAKARSVAYVLVTNLIAKLDEAAIREGRFDMHLGIYPPDVLSRFGRLDFVTRGVAKSLEGDLLERRIWAVVSATAGGSMNTLGKKHWFTAPNESDFKPETVFSYLFAPEDPRIRREDLEKKRKEYDCEAPRPPVEATLHLPAPPPGMKELLEQCTEEALQKQARMAAAKRSAPADPVPSASEAGADAKQAKMPHPCGCGSGNSDEKHATREYKEWAWVTIWDEDWTGEWGGPGLVTSSSGGQQGIRYGGGSARS